MNSVSQDKVGSKRSPSGPDSTPWVCRVETDNTPDRRSLAQGKAPRAVIPGLVVCGAAVLFVTMDFVEQQLFPDISIGMHHALLSLWAVFVAASTYTIVYLLMRHQHQRLSDTADQLSRLLTFYQAGPGTPHRFENPHLVHCREIANCDQPDCPMYDSPGERCWQVMSLRRADNHMPTRIELKKCMNCQVYRASCPDKLTELGESFNNLMFLLEEEAEQVGRMRGQMVEQEKMVAIGQIAAGIAHEVGNPLSSISSVVQMLKRAGASPEMTQQLDLIETHIQRISSTVRRLVTLARPAPERWELMDINQAVEEVVRLIAYDRRARNVQIDFFPSGSLPRTFALRAQLQQVFINLLLNALDAMPNGGNLSINAEEKNGDLLVSVKDTGCGIPPEDRQRIFEPFFTTKPQGQGTGLGLAVSCGVIEKHNGTIHLDSTVGQGTEFTIQIPVLDKAPDV